MRKRVIVLGATGSIGSQTLDVIRKYPDRFSVAGLSAHSDVTALLSAGKEHGGVPLCLSGSPTRDKPDGIRYSGRDGLDAFVRETNADIVMNACAGADGLGPSMAALLSGKDLALANKETIVMAGRFVLSEARRLGRKVLPVDSEHAAVFQLVESVGRRRVKEIVLTASGGAFRDRPIETLKDALPEEALAHPTWNMGRKITIDSASMANKGLEVIETARLFDAVPSAIKVVIHPESAVHALVRTMDGSLFAQVSRPDMRLPILEALAWPDCPECGLADLDLAGVSLNFIAVDHDRYPLLPLAYAALESGDGACAAYNAANEEAVAAFLERRIRFTDLSRVTDAVLGKSWPALHDSIETTLETDRAARVAAKKVIKEMS